jgi:hypothetical protein
MKVIRSPYTKTFAALLIASALQTGIALAEGVGEEISPRLAEEVLPYAQLSQQVYNPGGAFNAAQVLGSWQKIGDWQSELKKHKASLPERLIAKGSGFYAAIYQNTKTGEVVVSYRGTRSPLKRNDDLTDAMLLAGISRPGVAKAASDLAKFVKQDFPNSKITLTGHSLGGYWATYAGEKAGINNVVTFAGARGPAVNGYNNPNQINVVVSGEIIGDPNTRIGNGHLPGKLYGVDSMTGSQSVFGDVGAHHIEGIIGGLAALALRVPSKHAAASNTPQSNVQTARPNASGSKQAAAPAAKSPSTDLGGAQSRLANAPPNSVRNARNWATLTPSWEQSSANNYPFGRDLPPPKTVAQQPPSNSAIRAAPAPAVRAAPAPQVSFAPAPTSYVALRVPGGVSISKAAAERMPIGFDIEASYLKDGPLILSGRKDSTGSIDAAIMLTAIRAACEPSDPYFSLDTDGVEWIAESKKAREELISRIRGDLFISKLTPTYPVGTTYRTISARRDYPAIWAKISARYPHLRSKLVFRPSWLAQTRFGEILYKGDVLLKELAGGSPVFNDGTVKANRVGGYTSYSMRVVSKGLQSARNGVTHIAGGGQSRLWFDLISPDEKSAIRDSSKAEKLTLVSARRVIQDGSALDFSSIYPRMFVKRHDLASGTDLDVPQPEMDALSSQVNSRIRDYAAQYPELQQLTQVFRAYIVAAQVAKQEPAVCRRVAAIPLLDSEKVNAPLPEFHASELFVTVGRTVFAYATKKVRGRRAVQASSAPMQGGVSIAAKTLMELGVVQAGSTPLSTSILTEIERKPQAETARASDRLYLALDLSDKPAPAPAAVENRSAAPPVPPPVPKPTVSPDVPPPPAPPEPPVINKKVALAESTTTNTPPPKQKRVLENNWSNYSARDSSTGLFLLGLSVFIVIFITGLTLRVTRKNAAKPARYDAKGQYPSGAWAMPDRSETRPMQASTPTPPTPRRTLDKHARSNQPKPFPSPQEVRFKNAFSTVSPTRREEMIAAWRARLNCTREDAIERLLTDLYKDNRAWRG